MAALIKAHSRRLDGTELRKQFDGHGLQYGPAFAGLAAVHHADETIDTVLGEVGLPGPIRSQHSAYVVHPPCWTPASSRSRPIAAPRSQATPVCCCRWAYAESVPTVLPAPRVTATRR